MDEEQLLNTPTKYLTEEQTIRGIKTIMEDIQEELGEEH